MFFVFFSIQLTAAAAALFVMLPLFRISARGQEAEGRSQCLLLKSVLLKDNLLEFLECQLFFKISLEVGLALLIYCQNELAAMFFFFSQCNEVLSCFALKGVHGLTAPFSCKAGSKL